MDSYNTLAQPAIYEMEIKRSRFICYAFPITDSEDAIAKYRSIQKKHSDATHNCYAFVCEVNENTVRFSDDGEPSGTAGQPILEVLKKRELKNSLLVVTRYFGGIKLGGGGLVGAYTESAAGGVAQAGIVTAYDCRTLILNFDYSLIGAVDNTLGVSYVRILSKEYDAAITYRIAVKDREYASLRTALMDCTGGKIDIRNDANEYIFFDK